MAIGVGSTGSGLDVQSTVQGLVQTRRAPEQQRISDRRTEIVTEISAFGRVQTAIDGLTSSIRELRRLDNYNQHTVTNTDPELYTAQASRFAAPGDYNLSVLQLAQSHKILSGTVADRENIGSGELIFSLGEGEDASSFSVELLDNPYSNNSLDDLAQMINSHPENEGIVAGIIQDEQGAHLVLSSRDTGAAHQISVESATMNGSLGQFDTDSLFMQQLSAGQDAAILLDGLRATSDTNTFSDTIKGVDITALKVSETEDGGLQSGAELRIENDRSNIQGLVQSFVDSYNQFFSTLNSETRHDEASDSDGALRGNSVLSAAGRQIRSALNERVVIEGSDIHNLSELGITTSREGNLVLDSGILNEQISNNFQSVQAFFTERGGFTRQFAEKVDIFAQTGGAIDSASQSLIDEQGRLNTEEASLDRRMQAYEERLSRQYSSLDSSINELTSQLGYIQNIV